MPLKTIAPMPLSCNDKSITISCLKSQLQQFKLQQDQQFDQGLDVALLIKARANYIDRLLQYLWFHFIPKSIQSDLQLIAVGGYGRGELHPLSDIDLLILSHLSLTSEHQEALAQFLALLWDLNLHISHSVRTLAECQQEASNDLTVYTNLLESRLIIGDGLLLEKLKKWLFSDAAYSAKSFLIAKLTEQQLRHQRYHGSGYNLEPDVKMMPGGLRDIHTLQWIALRHFNVHTIDDMTRKGFLTIEEQADLTVCLSFLWRIRFALHSMIKRPDNRLLFDRQLTIAQRLNYHGQGNQPIEAMMKAYYRVNRRVIELNALLLQIFDESILAIKNQNEIIVLDDHFQLMAGKLTLRQTDCFHQHPAMIMQLFHHLAYQPQALQIHSSTLRSLRSALRQQRHQSLSDDPNARRLFIAILQHPQAIRKAFQSMHHLGILAAYIPKWHLIVGQTQFDLFHAYTVDEHTVRLLQILENFQNPSSSTASAFCKTHYDALTDKIPLYFAALFHDIAKGRGGDHSSLGAEDVRPFALQHGLTEAQCDLACWLVQHHLLMSITAQRRDIQDNNVIEQFANDVKSIERLRYLLCLTVADIMATNENLWNSWKQSLLQELYQATQKFIQQGAQPVNQLTTYINQKQQQAQQLLAQEGDFSLTALHQLWQSCCDDYFLRHNIKQLAWHARHLLSHELSHSLVLINETLHRGGTEIFIYSPDRPYLFATVAGELDRRHLTVLDAQIFTHRDGMAMDTFIILDRHHQPLSQDRHPHIQSALQNLLQLKTYSPPKVRRSSFKLRCFSVAPKVTYLNMDHLKRTYLELTALDRPGLLAQVGEIFADLGLSLHSAKISTIGERVKDLFILTEANHCALTADMRQRLKQQLLDALTPNDKM